MLCKEIKKQQNELIKRKDKLLKKCEYLTEKTRRSENYDLFFKLNEEIAKTHKDIKAIYSIIGKAKKHYPFLNNEVNNETIPS